MIENAIERPMILVIDDSATIRKMVECHLSQAGYRVTAASDAQQGLKLAQSIHPDLILLDHQLPGTTGDDVCRRLLESEATAKVPVVISSALRNRAFAKYTEFPNVVDQIPKPFTPELLKGGVANALQTGAMVVQAQRTGCAMPELVVEGGEASLEGSTAAFPLRSVLDFLNNGQQAGRLTLESGRDRFSFALAGGRIQAVVSPTINPEQLNPLLPSELGEVAALLEVTLGERQDAPMSGLVRLLERSLSDPRRLRALLRWQAAVLTHQALTAEPGHFAFEPKATSPSMFQAFPLQLSLAALAVDGVRHCVPLGDAAEWSTVVFARRTSRGGNLDRTGLSTTEIRLHALMDGTADLAALGHATGMELALVANVARGLELAGHVERRHASAHASILVLEDDLETTRTIQHVLGPEAEGYQIKAVRDRVGAQLLLRRHEFDLVMMALDKPEQEAFYRSSRQNAPAKTRFVGILNLEEEGQLSQLDALSLDGVLHRPVSEVDLRAMVNYLLTPGQRADASQCAQVGGSAAAGRKNLEPKGV